MTPSAPLSHVNYKVVHNIIRMLIHGFCMNGEIICFEVPIWDAFEVSFDHFFFSLCKFVKSVGEMGHQSERCQFTSKPVSWTQAHACFQLHLLPQKPCSVVKVWKLEKESIVRLVHAQSVCVRAEARTFTHTCLQVVSSWACLWERTAAGWFCFCLAPREAPRIFLLQGAPLPISEGKPLCHPCYVVALPKQQAA